MKAAGGCSYVNPWLLGGCRSSHLPNISDWGILSRTTKIETVCSPVLTVGTLGEIFCLHFSTLPRIMSSPSSNLKNHNLQSSRKPVRAHTEQHDLSSTISSLLHMRQDLPLKHILDIFRHSNPGRKYLTP